MVAPIVNPEIPYNGEIPGGLQAGKMCRIQGVTLPEADRFNINLQVGPNSSPRDDTALHVSVRLNQGYIARNSYSNGEWGEEQGDGTLPIGHAQSWEMIILVDHKDFKILLVRCYRRIQGETVDIQGGVTIFIPYELCETKFRIKIAVNGQHFSEFPHRLPISEVTHLLIDGQVSVTLISWEGIMGVSGAESQSSASQVNAEGPQGGYGPPPQTYGGPQQAYGGSQQGYGAPMGGYGMPAQGYGPPVPPGAQPEGGFDSFLDSAQTMLAGAIKSGAAEKLLGGLLSSGGNQQGQHGYAHQNAQYGIYPELPKDLDPNYQDKKQAPGPVQNLLSGLLSGGNKQPAQPGVQSQPTQQQSVDFGAILAGLLSGNQQPQQPDVVPPTRRNYQQNVPANPQNQGVDLGTLLGGLFSGGKQQPHPQQSGTQQNLPANHQNQGIDYGSLLGGLLSGGKQQPGQVPQQQGHQNVQGNTQQQGVDFGSLLGGLLSGGTQQQGQVSPPQSATHQNIPGNTQHQGVDFGSLSGGLLSGGTQQQGQVPPSQGAIQQNVPGNTQKHAGDIGSFLSGLLSNGTQHQGQVPAHGTTQQNVPGGQHSQGVDLGSLLEGLLGPNQQKQQPGQAPGTQNTAQQHNVDVGALLTGIMSHIQTRPIQETHPTGGNPATPQVPPPTSNQQSQGHGGFDLNSLLGSLLSGGGQGNQASGGQQPPASGGQTLTGGHHNATGGYNDAIGGHQPGTGGTQAPTGGQQPGIGGAQVPIGGIQRQTPKAREGEYEDVTDQLAQLIAQQGGKKV